MRPEQTDQYTLGSDPSKLDADTSITQLNHSPSNNPSSSSATPPSYSGSAKPRAVFPSTSVFQNSVQSSSPFNASPDRSYDSSSIRSSLRSTNEVGQQGPSTPQLKHHKLDLRVNGFLNSSATNHRHDNNVNIPRLTFSPETPPASKLNTSAPSPSKFFDSAGASSTNFFNMKSTRGEESEGQLLGESSGSGSSPNQNHRSALLNGNSHSNGLSSSHISEHNDGKALPHAAGNLLLNGSAGSSGSGSGSAENSALGAGNHSHSSSFSAEENFECVGEGPESFLESHSENTSLQFARDVTDLTSLSVPGDNSGAPPIRRNSWLRTSLRKSPQQSGSSPNGETMGHRRWGSFRNSSGSKRVPPVTSSSALANQLYRSSSFHSSGRSSAGDGEEMYSDGSLEDEVIDLTQKVHHLEEKFSVLAENQTDVDDRYVRIKQENAELSTKLFMAEESLRDVEQRAEEKLKDEQRRFKDILARSEREKQLQIENYDIRLRSSEKDLEQAKGEMARLKQKLERERQEKSMIRDKLLETERELATVREDDRALMDAVRKERDTYLLEAKAAQQALLELKKEFELSSRKQRHDAVSVESGRPGHNIRFNSVDSDSETAEILSRLSELTEENKRLKQENRQLLETNEELNAQILNHGLEEGRHLLTVNRNIGDMGNSLAAEFEAMSLEQLKKALKEQTEVNDQLRAYIDGILLNIVENYPQLLEVKRPSATPENSLPSSN